MRKGDQVRLIQPVIEGEIKKVVWDEEADEKNFLVALVDVNGVSRERWLRESQVEDSNV